MTAIARDLLAAFESLDPAEKQEVAVEILRRARGTGELPVAAFDELGVELFRSYDAEEAAFCGARAAQPNRVVARSAPRSSASRG